MSTKQKQAIIVGLGSGILTALSETLFGVSFFDLYDWWMGVDYLNLYFVFTISGVFFGLALLNLLREYPLSLLNKIGLIIVSVLSYLGAVNWPHLFPIIGGFFDSELISLLSYLVTGSLVGTLIILIGKKIIFRRNHWFGKINKLSLFVLPLVGVIIATIVMIAVEQSGAILAPSETALTWLLFLLHPLWQASTLFVISKSLVK